MSLQSLIFLIGYRGTGKSTVARELARQLHWEWLDSDALLEEGAGRTIAEIFAEEGEPGFRELEAAILEGLCRQSKHVIATGGGVILRPENRARMRQAGWKVWLTADAATIWQRMQADATTACRRPALTVGGPEEVQELLRVREPLYRECADLTVDTVGRTPAEVAHLIQERHLELGWANH